MVALTSYRSTFLTIICLLENGMQSNLTSCDVAAPTQMQSFLGVAATKPEGHCPKLNFFLGWVWLTADLCEKKGLGTRLIGHLLCLAPPF